MPDELRKVPFSAELLDRVRDFECGDEPWAREVSDWIRNDRRGGALDFVRRGRCEVWLYQTETRDVVGYGSLGTTQWQAPPEPIFIIPWMGVQSRFKRQPPGPKEDRYAARIVLDLLATATERHRAGHASAALGLLVHPENTPAIRLYEFLGFGPWSHTHYDKSTGVTYQGMLISL